MSRRPRGNHPPARTDAPSGEPPQKPTIIGTEFWQGPLPPPAVLERFRDLVPDAPERIFAEWQKEAEHRRGLEKTSLAGNLLTIRIGQFGAIALVLVVLGLGGLGFWLGYPSQAATIVVSAVASIVGAFVYQRRKGQ